MRYLQILASRTQIERHLILILRSENESFVTCFTVTLISTATLTELIARFFKYDDSDSEMIHLIYLLYDVSRD